MVRTPTVFWLFITVASFGLAGRTSATDVRAISGVLVEPRTQAPIVGQKLALDRPPGDYTTIPFAMFIFGIPQPATIATAVTDQSGRFQFRTTKDRGRFLEIRIAGSAPADFRSRAGYAATHLSDTLYPDKPFVSFDAHIMHNPRGGFMPVPYSDANHLTNRWSQPLAAVKPTFDSMKQSSMFATLAPASGGSAPSR